jgi:hypothetical protein
MLPHFYSILPCRLPVVLRGHLRLYNGFPVLFYLFYATSGGGFHVTEKVLFF